VVLLIIIFLFSSAVESLSSDVSVIKGTIQSISDDISDIRDSLRLAPCEPDYPDGKTIAQIADEFVQKYEPVDVVVEESDVWQQSPDEAPRNYPRKL